MRQSTALLGRLSRLTRSQTQSTQPLHALSRLTGADDGGVASSALHRFLSSAVADSAPKAALPSPGDVLHQTSVPDAEGTPGTAGQPDHTSSSQNSHDLGTSADKLSSGSSSNSPTEASQKGGPKHVHQTQQQQPGRAPYPLKSSRQLEVEMDALLKTRKPGAY